MNSMAMKVRDRMKKAKGGMIHEPARSEHMDGCYSSGGIAHAIRMKKMAMGGEVESQEESAMPEMDDDFLSGEEQDHALKLGYPEGENEKEIIPDDMERRKMRLRGIMMSRR